MANVYAVKSGNWSDTTLWNTGSLPDVIDDVYAFGFTVYVDQNIQVLSINTIGATGIGGGGTFRPNNEVVMTTNVVAGSTTCVTFGSASPNSFSLIGNVSGGNTANIYGINNSSTGTVNITGNIIGGRNFNTTHGVYNVTSGLVTVVGSVSGTPFTTGGAGIYNATTGRNNIIGNVQGGLANHGVTGNVNTTVINITGNVYGGSGSSTHGIQFPYGSIITVLGDVYGGTGGSSHGFWMNNAASYPSMSAIVIGNIYNGPGSNSAGIATGGPITQFIWLTGNILNNPAGGTNNSLSFSTSGTVDIVGNVMPTGGGTRLSHGGAGTVNIKGNVIGSPFNINDHRGILVSSTGTLNITGTVINDRSVNGFLILTSISSPKVNVYGDVYGGTVTNSVAIYGDTNNTNSIITIYGNVYARDGGGVIQNQSGGTIIVYGDVYGGGTNVSGIRNVNIGTVIVSGAAVGGYGSAGYGALNSSTGILRVKRAVGNDWGLGYTTAQASVPGVFSSVAGSQTFVEELECGPRGQWPTGGVIFFTPNPKATSQFETDTFQNYSLIQSNSADNLLPPVSSVRQGEVYDLGMDTGTCIIPPASSVGFGVPVDNTTGTATLVSTNVWNISASEITDNQSIGGRLRNTLTANAAERLVNSFNLN